MWKIVVYFTATEKYVISSMEKKKKTDDKIITTNTRRHKVGCNSSFKPYIHAIHIILIPYLNT